MLGRKQKHTKEMLFFFYKTQIRHVKSERIELDSLHILRTTTWHLC